MNGEVTVSVRRQKHRAARREGNGDPLSPRRGRDAFAGRQARQAFRQGLARAGTKQNSDVQIEPRRFFVYRADNKQTVEPGDFTVMIGSLSDKFTLR
jgi:hypothetical protein